ncbi:MAG: CPBP family intramembrane metalloprotease [Planctomycetaceae bacterium]|nr:CPBP family intramembrane metalloprotease [Planctomycetaceae bacterium]
MRFFLLNFVLSVPFWLLAATTGLQLRPGLPVSSLAFVCPGMAAAILVYKESKGAGVSELLKRALDFSRTRAKAWYVPVALLMPVVTVLTYGLMRLMGMPILGPQFSPLAALAMFLAFCLTALGEELGWSGYVIDPLQERWNAQKASILVGIVWAIWHFVPLMQGHRSTTWIAWWSLYTVALRVLIVWLYNNTGRSVLAATLFHAFSNISSVTYSSYYDARITGLIVAFLAAIVILVWGPRALVRMKDA